MDDNELAVTLYGTHLGELVRVRDSALLRWSDEAEERWGINSPALSNCLRVGFTDIEQTEAFFGALLPEGNALEQLARRLRVGSRDLVGILSRVGGDVAGALTIGRQDQRQEPVRILGDVELEEAIRNARGFVIGGGGSAVAGVQNKIALTRVDGQWAIGNEQNPSTHILKPGTEETIGSLHREDYTLNLGRALGITTFETWVEQIGGRPVLVVERYDRSRQADGIVTRIHQEDLAQALTLPWGGNDKFEWDNPKANLAAIARTIDWTRTIFDTGESETDTLLRYVTFNVAVGNTDAHAKNYSILRPENLTPRLAPLYDAAPLLLGYESSQRLSMSIDGQQWLPSITVEHLVAEAAGWGTGEARAREIVSDTLEHLIAATQVTPADELIAETVPGFIRGQAKNLVAGKKADLGIPGPLALQRKIDSKTEAQAEGRP